MVENAIDRLKDRQRKKVNPRNASLNVADDFMAESSQIVNQSSNNESITESSRTINQSNSNDSITESSQTTNQSNNNDLMTKSSQTTSQLSSNDLMTGSEKVQEPIRRTVRLDPQVDDYMDVLCKEHRVTRETLIEAAMVVCSKNQRTLNKVITDAQDRYKDRKRKGELKKLETMSKKLKGI